MLSTLIMLQRALPEWDDTQHSQACQTWCVWWATHFWRRPWAQALACVGVGLTGGEFFWWNLSFSLAATLNNHFALAVRPVLWSLEDPLRRLQPCTRTYAPSCLLWKMDYLVSLSSYRKYQNSNISGPWHVPWTTLKKVSYEIQGLCP